MRVLVGFRGFKGFRVWGLGFEGFKGVRIWGFRALALGFEVLGFLGFGAFGFQGFKV